MARKFAQFLIPLLLLSFQLSARDALSKQDILKKILERAKQNEQRVKQFGYYQSTNQKKMKDGKITKEEARFYRITWIQNQPYLELLKFNGKALDADARKKETDRRTKFIKSLSKKEDDDDDDITWDDLYAKYDFVQLPPDQNGLYGFSFKPKNEKLASRSSTEKILNHISGKFWADNHFNILRAEGDLMDEVRFGLGILGKVERLQIKYVQQNFDDAPLPSFLFIRFKGRIALLKSEEGQIEATFKDYYRRPDTPGGQN
jgi:hypothetical protein